MSTTTTIPPTAPPIRARQPASRLPIVLLVWTVLLVFGFGLVLALGRPVPTSADELAAAFAPQAPVTEIAARHSADTIVRIAYQSFDGVEPQVLRSTDFGMDRFVLVYRRPGTLDGVRIAVDVATGRVTVATFP